MKLINITNHPSNNWNENQKSGYEEVIDFRFPLIDPRASEEEIDKLSDQFLNEVKKQYTPSDTQVMVMGEFTFSFSLIKKLKNNGFSVVAATTERKAIEEDGVKKSVFEFVRWREY